jgi:cytochrome c-type biogenesis protein CcmH
MRKLLAIAAMLAALLPAFALSPACALSPDELLKDPALEHRARALSAQLRCLVCQNQSIDDSDAPLAKDLRTLVREQLSAGKSDEEIMAFVVARYGEFVLLKPRLTPGTILLWGTPFAVLLIAGGALLLRRRRVETAPEMPLTEAERQALHRVTE